MSQTNSQDGVRQAIVATLQAIPDIGRIHDRERYAQQAAALVDLYGWAGAPDISQPGRRPQLRGWFVSLIGESHHGRRVGRRVCVAEWRIVGLLGFDDEAASELTAAALARAVVEALAADPTLGGLINRQADPASPRDGLSGPQIKRLEPVMFAGRLVHRVTISLITERFHG